MRNNVNSIWTAERMERLVTLQERKWSCSQIAAELGAGITRNAVIGKLHRMGITGGVAAIPERERILRAKAALARKLDKRKERRREFRAQNPTPTRAPIPLMVCLDVTPFGVTLLDLQPDTCRYPAGEGSDITFCGHPALAGRSYCAPHARLCVNGDRTWSKGAMEAARRDRHIKHKRTILEAAE
jgi:GcrA cell cycle regulator